MAQPLQTIRVSKKFLIFSWTEKLFVTIIVLFVFWQNFSHCNIHVYFFRQMTQAPFSTRQIPVQDYSSEGETDDE